MNVWKEERGYAPFFVFEPKCLIEDWFGMYVYPNKKALVSTSHLHHRGKSIFRCLGANSGRGIGRFAVGLEIANSDEAFHLPDT